MTTRMKDDRRESSPAPGPAAVAGATSRGGASDLCFTPARALVDLIRTRQVSAREVMIAHLEQIRRVNPTINAIVAKLDDSQCLALADEADRRMARDEPVGPLHGLPWAFKDLEAAVGFPLTLGSPIFRNFMPTEDTVLVERVRAGGALVIGKTNVPEFGMGSHTYNKVYGTTVNPYDVTKSAGGSSGGAGAALAAGLLPLADGSDLGGSLRNPANFNNVVALRPTVGLVPTWPTSFPLLGFSVNGPLARSVADVALLMSVMTGPDARDPSLLPADPALFRGTLARDFRGMRVAWCPDLGGLPLERSVRDVLEAQRKTFEDLGCIVEEAVPDLADADSIFLTLRAFRSAATYGPLLARYRDLLKPEAIGEIEQGQALTTAAVADAMVKQGQLFDRMRRFEERYAFTLCAVNQLPPFDAKLDWPKEIAGVRMEHYIAWLKTTYRIAATFRPAISVPAGFTPEGLPVGIQIVGRYRDDFGVLQLGHAFERATKVGLRRPPLA